MIGIDRLLVGGGIIVDDPGIDPDRGKGLTQIVAELPCFAEIGCRKQLQRKALAVRVLGVPGLVKQGIGFGKIGAAALESMARQPEVADKVSASMITVAALLEGATFFALIVCLLILFFA